MFKGFKNFNFIKLVRSNRNVRWWLICGLIFLIAFFVSLCLLIQHNRNNIYNLDIKVLGSLKYNMTKPKIVAIKTKDPDSLWMETQFLIFDDNNKSHIEIFYPETNKISILPKSNLNGNFQNYLPLIHTPNKFATINIIKEKNNDVCGIEIFDMHTNKWQKLKIKPILREAKCPPSIDIIYSKDKKPLLLIWGGVNCKTKKVQNTMEVIDLLSDKLLEKININFRGGKIVQLDNDYYLIGAQESDNEPVVIQSKKIKLNILPFASEGPIVYRFNKIFTGTLSSSLDREALLVIDNKNKNLVEYEMPNNIDSSIRVNKINIPKKYKEYCLVSNIDTNKGIILIFKNNIKQLLVLFRNTQNTKQNSSFIYRFILLKEIELGLDMTNAKFLEEGKIKYMSLICISNNKIIRIIMR